VTVFKHGKSLTQSTLRLGTVFHIVLKVYNWILPLVPYVIWWRV